MSTQEKEKKQQTQEKLWIKKITPPVSSRAAGPSCLSPRPWLSSESCPSDFPLSSSFRMGMGNTAVAAAPRGWDSAGPPVGEEGFAGSFPLFLQGLSWRVV